MMNESVSSVRMFAAEARRLTPASDNLLATCSSSNGLLRGEDPMLDRGGEVEYLEGLNAAVDILLLGDVDASELNLLACCSKLCI